MMMSSKIKACREDTELYTFKYVLFKLIQV